MNISEKGVIAARGLTRYYGRQRGVRDLDLTVPEGCVLGLLGENGSGKTTFLKLAMGALVPDRGEVTTLGVDPARMPPDVRARIGYVADRMEVPAWMTLGAAMELQAAFYPTWDATLADRLMQRLELRPTMVYKALSLGQQRRYMLLLVLAQRPELLALDEPAGGLDTAVRREFLELLMEMQAERPITIVLSSHILSDVERVVDRVAFMQDGRVIRTGELEDLRARVKRLVLPGARGESLLRERFKIVRADRDADTLLAVVEDFDPARLDGLEATVEHLNLEEIYLAFTAREPRDPVEAKVHERREALR
jgi:ABC-2 type transport system ATP-binding protein